MILLFFSLLDFPQLVYISYNEVQNCTSLWTEVNRYSLNLLAMFSVDLLCCKTLLTYVPLTDGRQVSQLQISLGKSKLMPSFTLLSFMCLDMLSWRKYTYPDGAKDILKTIDDSKKKESFYVLYSIHGLIEVHYYNGYLSNLDLTSLFIDWSPDIFHQFSTVKLWILWFSSKKEGIPNRK